MRVFACAVALGLGALVATPCLALTIQAEPQRPDVALHLHSSSTSTARGLPGPGQLQSSFVTSGRPQLGSGFTGQPSVGTASFGFGSLRASTTVLQDDGAVLSDSRRRDEQNPMALTPPRR